MSVDVEEYKRLKSNAEAARKAADKAEGAVEQMLDELEKVYGCKDATEACVLQEKLDAEEAAAEAAYNAEMEKFNKEWGEYLEGAE